MNADADLTLEIWHREGVGVGERLRKGPRAGELSGAVARSCPSEANFS